MASISEYGVLISFYMLFQRNHAYILHVMYHVIYLYKNSYYRTGKTLVILLWPTPTLAENHSCMGWLKAKKYTRGVWEVTSQLILRPTSYLPSIYMVAILKKTSWLSNVNNIAMVELKMFFF